MTAPVPAGLGVLASLLTGKKSACAGEATSGANESAIARDKALDDFAEQRSRFLITTGVLQRGVDIPSVKLVVLYSVPKSSSGSPDAEAFLHRVGRTGRFGQTGTAVSFVDSPQEEAALLAIEKHYKPAITSADDPNRFTELADPNDIERMLQRIFEKEEQREVELAARDTAREIEQATKAIAQVRLDGAAGGGGEDSEASGGGGKEEGGGV